MFRAYSRALPARAFTMIEIMVVVIIIGLLMAVAANKFQGQVETGRVTTTLSTLTNVETALESFSLKADRYPTTDEGLRALVLRPTGLAESEWAGPYLKDLPVDGWKNGLTYNSPGDVHEEYDLSAPGKDHQAGTADDILIKRRIDAEAGGSASAAP